MWEVIEQEPWVEKLHPIPREALELPLFLYIRWLAKVAHKRLYLTQQKVKVVPRTCVTRSHWDKLLGKIRIALYPNATATPVILRNFVLRAQEWLPLHKRQDMPSEQITLPPYVVHSPALAYPAERIAWTAEAGGLKYWTGDCVYAASLTVADFDAANDDIDNLKAATNKRLWEDRYYKEIWDGNEPGTGKPCAWERFCTLQEGRGTPDTRVSWDAAGAHVGARLTIFAQDPRSSLVPTALPVLMGGQPNGIDVACICGVA